MTQARGSYRVEDQLHGVGSELERLRAQALLSWREESRLLRFLGLSDGMDILEIGCGPGYVTSNLLAWLPTARLTAIDADRAMLDRARAEVGAGAQRVRFVEGRAEELPLPDAQADFVVARYLFQHVPDPGAVARDALRVLKPGGRLAVIDLDGALWGTAAPTFPEVMPVYAKTGRAQAALGGNRLIGRELFRILRDAGFSDVQLDAFVYHSDAKGLEAFGPQLDPDRLLPMVKRGVITGAEFELVRRAHDTFMATPGAYVMMIGLLASGARPAQAPRNPR